MKKKITIFSIIAVILVAALVTTTVIFNKNKNNKKVDENHVIENTSNNETNNFETEVETSTKDENVETSEIETQDETTTEEETSEVYTEEETEEITLIPTEPVATEPIPTEPVDTKPIPTQPIATEPITEPETVTQQRKPISLIVSISGDYCVGDTILPELIFAHLMYDDGAILPVNTAELKYSSLVITSEVFNVNFELNGFKTTVTVNTKIKNTESPTNPIDTSKNIIAMKDGYIDLPNCYFSPEALWFNDYNNIPEDNYKIAELLYQLPEIQNILGADKDKVVYKIVEYPHGANYPRCNFYINDWDFHLFIIGPTEPYILYEGLKTTIH